MKAIFHGRRDTKAIGLSFDDGPDWGEERLIFALNEVGMRATFFWICEKAINLQIDSPYKFNRIVRLLEIGGHELGIHAWSCEKPSLSKRFEGIESWELNVAQREMYKITGQFPAIYRPHCGLSGGGRDMIIGTHQLGNDLISKKILKPLYLTAFKVSRPGDIICGHDSKDCDFNFGIAPRIAKLVPEIKNILDKRGLRAVTISELLK